MGKLILNGIEYAGGPSIDDTNSSATKVYSSQKTQNLVSGTLGADVYDPTHTYATNDMCIYNNTLYKAKSSTTGNLPTNTTYWEPTTIADEINELNSRLPTLGNEVILSQSEPFITYRKYGHLLFLYINTQGMTISGDVTLGNLPADCTPLMGNREYRGSGFIACDRENNNRIWARNIDTWTTCTMALPI